MRAFVIAMRNEAEAVRAVLGRDDRLYISGIGKVNAAATTQRAIDEAAGREIEIWNAGVCGGFDPSMEIGDVYEVDRAVEYDFDLANLNGTRIGQLDERDGVYLPLITTGRLPVRTLATGDRFNDRDDDLALFRELGATLRDMEGAAIAHVCERNGVACHSIKSISNVQGRGSMVGQFRDNVARALERLSVVLRGVLSLLSVAFLGLSAHGRPVIEGEGMLSGWRNERINLEFTVRTDGTPFRLSARVEGIEPKAISIRRANGDKLELLASPCESDTNGVFRGWLQIKVPRKAKAGVHRGEICVVGSDASRARLPLKVRLSACTLPEPKAWKFFLDLWQHPWASARYANVEPFSKEHYAILRPMWEELAAAGQKTITTTITELPWNHQSFDAYHTMIRHIRRPDGSFRRDYSLWDEYVAFCESCGLGPQIHCYSLVPWGNVVYWEDETTGKLEHGVLTPGTKEHEAFWGPFLEEFDAHLKAQGRLGRVYMALDERNRTELEAVARLIRVRAPSLRLAMAGNHKPSAFKGIAIDNYSQCLQYVSGEFLDEVARTRQNGRHTTTFYVCCEPKKPNTFLGSSLAECKWLGLHAAAKGLDGLLRWAYANWPKDPLVDASFGNWPAGDTFLVYPNGILSRRWEALRDGIEEAEKIRLLREGGGLTDELMVRLRAIDYARAKDERPEELAADVEAVTRAVETAAQDWYTTKERKF